MMIICVQLIPRLVYTFDFDFDIYTAPAAVCTYVRIQDVSMKK